MNEKKKLHHKKSFNSIPKINPKSDENYALIIDKTIRTKNLSILRKYLRENVENHATEQFDDE